MYYIIYSNWKREFGCVHFTLIRSKPENLHVNIFFNLDQFMGLKAVVDQSNVLCQLYFLLY